MCGQTIQVRNFQQTYVYVTRYLLCLYNKSIQIKLSCKLLYPALSPRPIVTQPLQRLVIAQDSPSKTQIVNNSSACSPLFARITGDIPTSPMVENNQTESWSKTGRTSMKILVGTVDMGL